MKKILLVLLALAFTSYHHQVHTFDEVWEASLKTVEDLGFKIDNLDRNAGFIGAENGCQVCPVRLLIMVTELAGRIQVDYKILQKESDKDMSEQEKNTRRRFMTSMTMNLNP